MNWRKPTHDNRHEWIGRKLYGAQVVDGRIYLDEVEVRVCTQDYVLEFWNWYTGDVGYKFHYFMDAHGYLGLESISKEYKNQLKAVIRELEK